MEVAGINHSNSTRRALLERFGEMTAEAVTRAVDADWGCFYFLDSQLNSHTFRPFKTPAELRAAYVENSLDACDPLHPRKLVTPRRRFITIAEPGRHLIGKEDASFWAVLRSFGARRIGEMLFWEHGRPVAGLSVIWRTAPSSASLDRGFGVLSFVEFNLGNLLVDRRHAPVAGPGVVSKLSSRELEVALLACRGYTSGRIAQDLRIGVATVKTHLLHIFTKLSVGSRTELAALLLRNS